MSKKVVPGEISREQWHGAISAALSDRNMPAVADLLLFGAARWPEDAMTISDVVLALAGRS